MKIEALHIIGRGTLELHPYLKHIEIDEETWFPMREDERQEYTDMVFKTKLEEVECVNWEREESLNRTIPFEGNYDTKLKDSNETSTRLNSFEVLA